jgi:hypothetical protein
MHGYIDGYHLPAKFQAQQWAFFPRSKRLCDPVGLTYFTACMFNNQLA